MSYAHKDAVCASCGSSCSQLPRPHQLTPPDPLTGSHVKLKTALDRRHCLAIMDMHSEAHASEVPLPLLSLPANVLQHVCCFLTPGQLCSALRVRIMQCL